jgi:hypothetical protein
MSDKVPYTEYLCQPPPSLPKVSHDLPDFLFAAIGCRMSFETFHLIVVHAEFGFVRRSGRDSLRISGWPLDQTGPSSAFSDEGQSKSTTNVPAAFGLGHRRGTGDAWHVHGRQSFKPKQEQADASNG